MAIVLLVSFAIVALMAGYLLEVNLSDMLPFVWCGLILILYILAFGKGLSLIDYILPITALGCTGMAVYRNKTKSGLTSYLISGVTSAPAIIYLLLALIVSIGVSDKIITWWDDVNFWASDVKSIFYLDGFASKYANVSPEFGDYPPGVQLAKWFILHLKPDEYRENLAFVGYYLFNLSFLMPLFEKIRRKNLWLAIPMSIISWLFAGMADKYGYAGFCADLTMAFLFGSILICAVDCHEENGLFDIARVSLYLPVLVLVKSTGAIWALFGLLIWIVVCCINYKTEKNSKSSLARWLKIIIPMGSAFVFGLSWLLFCMKMHRVTKTTSTAITYITTDKYGLSEYTGRFISSFAKAFFLEPVHADHTWIDISPALMLILIIAAFIYIFRKKELFAKAGKFIGIALPVMGVAYYALIFLAHITIFATEAQYLEQTAMIASIERYGAPFMLGSLMLISWIWLIGSNRQIADDTPDSISQKQEDKKIGKRSVIFIAVVLLLTNIPAAYEGLIGYRNSVSQEMTIRTDFVDDEAKSFLDTIRNKLPDGNTRVCRMHNGEYYRVADTYIAYEASPVSVIAISYKLDDLDEGYLINSVNLTHATYFYADYQDSKADWLDDITDSGEFKYRTLYYVSYEGGGMKLYEQ